MEISAQAKNNLSQRRYQHVMGVVAAITILAEINNVNVEKAQMIAWWHDITKEKSLEWQLNVLGEIGNVDPVIIATPKLHHAFTAAYLMEKAGIDQDLVEAVKYHTIGHPDFTIFGKLLYVADFVEVGRTNPLAHQYFEIAKQDLDLALFNIATAKVGRLNNPHPLTLALVEKYQYKVNNEAN